MFVYGYMALPAIKHESGNNELQPLRLWKSDHQIRHSVRTLLLKEHWSSSLVQQNPPQLQRAACHHVEENRWYFSCKFFFKKRTQGSTFYYKHGDIKLSCMLQHNAAITRPKVCMFQEQNYDMSNPGGLKERVMECERKSTLHEESAARSAGRKKALSFPSSHSFKTESASSLSSWRMQHGKNKWHNVKLKISVCENNLASVRRSRRQTSCSKTQTLPVSLRDRLLSAVQCRWFKGYN